MDRIDPEVLRKLRKIKGWSLKTLADKSKTDKQTIWRLENGTQDKTREFTVEKLARALNVAPAVLTGEAPVPESPDRQSTVNSRYQLNVRIGTRPRNALTLVSRRYGIEPSRIVELAPFLFLWAAEASLRQRRERIAEVERACEAARKAEKIIPHLPVPNFTYSEEKIEAEYESIRRRDLFGAYIILETDLEGLDFGIDTETDNPLATFLRGLTASISDIAEFEEWVWSWSDDPWTPKYRICPEEAAELVGGDRDRAEEILDGLVALHEMPKEIRTPEKSKERAEWVRERAEEHRRQIAELDTLFAETKKEVQ